MERRKDRQGMRITRVAEFLDALADAAPTRRRCGAFSNGSNGNTARRRIWLIDRGVPTEEVRPECAMPTRRWIT